MNIATELRDDRLIVRVTEDRIDAAGAIRFKDLMREAVRQPAQVVLLDLSRVTFLDSSGLGAIVSVMKLLPAPRRLELASLTPTVAKVFRLTRMDSVITIHPALPDDYRDAV